MSDRFTVLRDYCTSFQQYREARPSPCSIEEEYELRKRIAAADAMAKALEAVNAYRDMENSVSDLFHIVRGDTTVGAMIDSALAAYNALK